MFTCLESLCSRKTIPLLTALHLQLEWHQMSYLHVIPVSPPHVVMLTMLLKSGHGMARQCMDCGCGCGPVVDKPAASTIVSETLHLLDKNTGLYCVMSLFYSKKEQKGTPKLIIPKHKKELLSVKCVDFLIVKSAHALYYYFFLVFQ